MNALPYWLSLVVAMGAAGGSLWAWKSADRPTPANPAALVPGPKEAVEPTPIRDFVLTDQDGRPFDSKSLRGQVWVASFFFSSCPATCFRLNQSMADINHRLADENIHLVSITVDPESDTPAALKEYASRFKADPARWTFLTGPIDEIELIGQQGFKLATQRQVHSERAVVIDQEGRAVGTFNALDPAQVKKMQAVIDELLDEA